VRLSTLQWIGETTFHLTANFVRTDYLSGGEDTPGSPPPRSFSSRVSLFRAVGENTWAELGLSAVTTLDRPSGKERFSVAAADAKVKWKPDMYRAAVLQMEFLRSFGDAPEGFGRTSRAKGFFAALDVRWRRLWDGGGFVDWLEADSSGKAFGAFLGFMPAEETLRVSLVYRAESRGGRWNHSLTTQFLWSLGPHKPHPF
jgi:hypothetical protein